jgi:hypothetical protein
MSGIKGADSSRKQDRSVPSSIFLIIVFFFFFSSYALAGKSSSLSLEFMEIRKQHVSSIQICFSN